MNNFKQIFIAVFSLIAVTTNSSTYNKQRPKSTMAAHTPSQTKQSIKHPMPQLGKAAPLHAWKAGQQVSRKAIDNYGIDRCFTSETISDTVFKRIYGKSFKTGCTIPRSDLRYLRLLHYTIEGKIQLGEIVCHKDIANDLITIFKQLFDARYPIASMRLIDDFNAQDEESMEHNNTSCFNFRFVAGTKRLSNHSKGKAIDLNPLYNPYVKRRADGSLSVSPQKGRPYANRSKTFDYKIDKNDLAYKLFTSHGFEWGGNWKSLKDYQHFEKK